MALTLTMTLALTLILTLTLTLTHNLTLIGTLAVPKDGYDDVEQSNGQTVNQGDFSDRIGGKELKISFTIEAHWMHPLIGI